MLAITAWTWFTPSLERAASFQLDWMLEIALRNLVIVLVVAGGLHLLLFTVPLCAAFVTLALFEAYSAAKRRAGKSH